LPIEVAQIISQIYKFGLWEFFGITFTGFPLLIIWLIEAFIIVYGPIKIIKDYAIPPFSILHKKWYSKYILSKDFESIFSENKIIEGLNNNPVAYVNTLEHGRANNHTRISVFLLKEETVQYLRFENVKKDRDGKNATITEIVSLFPIKSNEAKELIKKFYAKKIFILDY